MALRASALATLITFLTLLHSAFAQEKVRIRVDAARAEGVLEPVWAFFGCDEPNYTYTSAGSRLLTELSALSPEPVYVRVHNLLTTGDGTPALKWGSTNAYTEDANGNPIYDWTIVDRIFDVFVQRGMRPVVEVGFMPEALSVKPHPYRHQWDPSQPYQSIYTGWACPPRDYHKFSELVYQWSRHCIQRYGETEVLKWYWEVWNEPDIGYWQGTPEEYLKLYDYSVDALKRALPAIRVGGPASTGPSGEKAAIFLQNFLEHVLRGTNYATGRMGAPLDYVTFHAKGRPKVLDGHVQMGSEYQLRDIDRGFQIVSGFPELRRTPIIIGESDPEGCAACSVRSNPQNAYRNGEMYPSYTASVLERTRELAMKHAVNFRGAVTWAFEFEGQPWFAGFRDLSTNGVDKPILNVFRMFGLMPPSGVHTESSGALDLATMLRAGVKSAPDIHAIASRGETRITVLAWNYHDDDVPAADAAVDLEVLGLPSHLHRVLLRHYRIDQNYSNSYTRWKAMGSPQDPTPAQRSELQAAGQLQSKASPEWVPLQRGAVHVDVSLPRHAVSLLEIDW